MRVLFVARSGSASGSLLNEGFTGLCHKDLEGLASVPQAILGPVYSGKPWGLVPALLEDRLCKQREGTEWARRDRSFSLGDRGKVVEEPADATRFAQVDRGKEFNDEVTVRFDLFDDVSYYGVAPKDVVRPEEQKQKLAIVRHMIESMAEHLAAGDARYDTIHVFYLDDRDDLLEHVGPTVGVAGNATLQRKLQGKANRLSFSCVRSE